MNIAIAGIGHVGLSIATLLAQDNHVTAVDIIPGRVNPISRQQSPIRDEYLGLYIICGAILLAAYIILYKIGLNASIYGYLYPVINE